MFPSIPAIETSPTSDDHSTDSDGAHRLYQSALKAAAGSPIRHRGRVGVGLTSKWKRTSRRYFWRLDRWKPVLDRFREAARMGGVVCSARRGNHVGDAQAEHEAFVRLVRVTELFSRRLSSARRPDWAIELLLDAIRATGDLRREADWKQMRVAIESELHLFRQLRSVVSRRRVSPDLLERTVATARQVFGRCVDRGDLWRLEYERRTEPRFRVDGDATVPPREHLRRAVYDCLIAASESEHPGCRDLFTLDGREVRFRFPGEYSSQHGIGDEDTWASLVDDNLKAELVDLFQISQQFDARDTAAAATLSFLVVAAYHRRLGFYPESLQTACDEFDQPMPVDRFAADSAPMQMRQAGGERIRGIGVDRWKDRVNTRVGQPVLFSVGPDRISDRGAVAWDGSPHGSGDWIFPLPAHRRPRHLLQFDLRKALIAMTLACVYLAYFTSGPARQRRAIQRIQAEGGTVEFSSTPGNSLQASLQRWFGMERFGTPHHADISVASNLGSLLQAMSEFDRLQTIGLTSCTVNEGDLQHLENFKQLRRLYLESAEVPPKEYAHLARLPMLMELSCGDGAITDDGFKHLPALPRLTSLSVSHTELTGATFDDLARRFPGLTDLTLYNSKVTDEALEEVGKLRRLTFLDVDSTNITDAGVEHLRDLVELITLDIQRTPITDAALRHFSKMTKLESLRLNSTKVTGSGFVHLANLPKLADISMDGTLLSDKEAPLIAKMPALRTLSVDGTRLTPMGMRALSKLQADITYPQWPTPWFLETQTDSGMLESYLQSLKAEPVGEVTSP